MSEISKIALSNALPEELKICIGDYLCGTQAQWRIIFQESLEIIERGRYCEPYCHRMHKCLFFLHDEDYFLRFSDDNYDDDDEDYSPPSDDEDYDLLV
jgi:hypothetical protein